MEFNDKLQELRKQKGLTQEQLAEKLYVSRTAVSKWESGRGYPSIDSLKEIAKFFSVTVDELLSCGEIITIAQQENNQRKNHLNNIVYGLLDLSCILLFVLPFFAHRSDSLVKESSLLSLLYNPSLLVGIYVLSVSAIVLCGVFTLVTQNADMKFKRIVSLFLSGLCLLVFIAGLQPYAAVFVFVFFVIKLLIMLKQ